MSNHDSWEPTEETGPGRLNSLFHKIGSSSEASEASAFDREWTFKEVLTPYETGLAQEDVDQTTISSDSAVHSYFSQSESCTEKRTVDDVESSDVEDTSRSISLCYKPQHLNSCLVERVKALTPPCGWNASLGDKPCPTLRDTLMVQIPQTIYGKMQSWGHSELSAMAERRIRVRSRALGVAVSDMASEYLVRLCCAVLLLTIMYDLTSGVYLMTIGIIGYRWWHILILIAILGKNIMPYLMSLSIAFGAGYVVWMVAVLIILTCKLVLLIDLIIIVGHGWTEGTTGLARLEADTPEIAIAVAIACVILVCFCDCLSLVTATVLRQVNQLEERLIRIVHVHEKLHKRLNCTPFELWCVGLYNGERGQDQESKHAPPEAQLEQPSLYGMPTPVSSTPVIRG